MRNIKFVLVGCVIMLFKSSENVDGQSTVEMKASITPTILLEKKKIREELDKKIDSINNAILVKKRKKLIVIH